MRSIASVIVASGAIATTRVDITSLAFIALSVVMRASVALCRRRVLIGVNPGASLLPRPARVVERYGA
jgi:hypothetical protein